MGIHKDTRIQAYQLRAGGARARMALLRMMATESGNNFNPHTRLQPGDWRRARHYKLSTYAAAFGTFSGGAGQWYSHNGPEFRDERDADDIVRSLPRGWYTDTDCGETAIGIVARLTHGRFLAGYRWTANDERVYFPEVFTDEDEAARRADGHAEWFADQSREDSERFDAMQNAEIALQDAADSLRDVWALRRMNRRTSDDVSDAIAELRQARETLAECTAAYERG